MEKKILFAIAALAITGAANATTPKLSPFTDNLTLQFRGFPHATQINPVYVSNNGININGAHGAYPFNTDSTGSVIISSNNKVDSGTPSMALYYPTMHGTQNCTLTFLDGPWVPALTYNAGIPPICAGITVGAIQQQGSGAYLITITDNEP